MAKRFVRGRADKAKVVEESLRVLGDLLRGAVEGGQEITVQIEAGSREVPACLTGYDRCVRRQKNGGYSVRIDIAPLSERVLDARYVAQKRGEEEQ